MNEENSNEGEEKVDEEKEDDGNLKKICDIFSSEKVERINLNDYKIKKLINEGGFGVVYKIAKKDQKQKQEFFAAKVFKNEYIYELDINSPNVANFLREIIINSKFTHSLIFIFICNSPYNFINFPYKKRPVMMTEYIEYGSLKKIIQKLKRKKKMPNGWNETKKMMIVYGIAAAMSHLHSMNIIHRDLKPSNVLIDHLLNPKLTDFGISIKLTNNEFIKDKIVIGSTRYIAPEIWNYHKYGKASDVYAFGILVFELFSKKFFLIKSFRKKYFMNVIFHIVTEKYRPKINERIPEVYRNLIQMCWDDDENKRPTFDQILLYLRNNSKVPIENADVESYNKYIEIIDDKL